VWNAGDNGIQTVGDVEVRNNLVFNSGASGIASKPSQGEVVKDLRILHNTVIGAGDVCLRGNDYPGGGAILVANNALFCEGGTAIKLPNGAGQAVFAGNAVVGGIEGAPGGTFDGGSVAGAFVDAANLQAYPSAASPLIDAGDAADPVTDDFNCLPRDGTPDVGAYGFSGAANPGWLVAPGFKACAGGGTDSDTDSDTGDTTGDTGDATGGSDTGDESGSGEGGAAPTTGASGDDPTGASDPTATTEVDPSGSLTLDTDGGGDLDDGSGCGCRGAPGGGAALLLGLLALRRRRR
jgi:hypothetical protein